MNLRANEAADKGAETTLHFTYDGRTVTAMGIVVSTMSSLHSLLQQLLPELKDVEYDIYCMDNKLHQSQAVTTDAELCEATKKTEAGYSTLIIGRIPEKRAQLFESVVNSLARTAIDEELKQRLPETRQLILNELSLAQSKLQEVTAPLSHSQEGKCSGCGDDLAVVPYYICTQCEHKQVVLCQDCEQKEIHAAHVLLKIRGPEQLRSVEAKIQAVNPLLSSDCKARAEQALFPTKPRKGKIRRALAKVVKWVSKSFIPYSKNMGTIIGGMIKHVVSSPNDTCLVSWRLMNKETYPWPPYVSIAIFLERSELEPIELQNLHVGPQQTFDLTPLTIVEDFELVLMSNGRNLVVSSYLHTMGTNSSL